MQHPDEGTIHAWLDGALSADDARAFEAHVVECAECAAAVTEARGLLAASSRILSALDSVPGGVLPATEPEATSGERVIPIGGRSRWRSPGWRAAAAIVLVGSVSWLATRSVGKQAEEGLSSAPEAAIFGRYDSVTQPLARVQADSTASVAERSTPPTASRVAPRVAQSTEQRLARESGGANAKAGRAAAPPAPAPQVAAAPQAIPYAMPKLVESPNAGIGAGARAGVGVGGAAKIAAQSAAGATAPTAQSAPPSTSANATVLDESRAADAAIRLRGAAKAAARPKSSAPSAVTGSLQMREALSARDADVERIAGCYRIETSASQSSVPGIRSAASLVPAQVELSTERDSSAGGDWRILRPAPAAPRFRLTARASWTVVTADSVRLELGEGMKSVSARFAVKGDSVHGIATVTDQALPAGGMGTGMRGSRMLCSTP